MTGFLLGIRNGRIALWKEEDPLPLYVFPISADALPTADRAALERGIHVADPTALAKLLEDYRDFFPR